MIYFKNEKIDDFNEIALKYGKNEFKSPYRSTIPLLIFFNDKKWDNFELIENSGPKDIKYIFEHETPVFKGNGKPSCTDLMVESKNSCVAIEAKRTEPAYETVKKWLGNSDNRKLVLEGWLEIIEKSINDKIDKKLIEDFPYQLIHRVASACNMNKTKTYVVYLLFSLDKSKIEYYSSCIDSFLILLKGKIKLQLICIKIDKLDEQIRLESLWDKGERDLSNSLIDGLKQNNLMRFNY